MEGPGECENQLATSDRGPPRSPYHCLIQTRRHYSVLKDGFRTKKGISVNASHQKDISYRICTPDIETPCAMPRGGKTLSGHVSGLQGGLSQTNEMWTMAAPCPRLEINRNPQRKCFGKIRKVVADPWNSLRTHTRRAQLTGISR